MASDIHRWAEGKGWWDTDKADGAPKVKRRNALELCALVSSEVSEAVEEARIGRMRTEYEGPAGKPVGFFSELADVVIRVMDIFEAEGVSLEQEIRIKMNYNELRAQRHGGKLA